MNRRNPLLLLINPWIADVAAFDLWAWPLGLLRWASVLRAWGFDVKLLDCTDRAHPALPKAVPGSKKFHTGKYWAEDWPEQPEPARRAERVFRRFGLPTEAFEAELDRVEIEGEGPPDAILLSSRLTYWYPGVFDAIARLRRRWPATPVLLGGIYATLCHGHARAGSGADRVFAGASGADIARWLAETFPKIRESVIAPPENPVDWPRPAFDLCHSRESLPITTSFGCPHRCSYCASRLLQPVYARRTPAFLFEEITEYHEKWGCVDFAFYDDALLERPDANIRPLLRMLIQAELPARFHTPNGMRHSMIDAETAALMRAARFETIRISLESSDNSQLARWNRSEDADAFRSAVRALRDAGYAREDIGVYIMAGMPGQDFESVRRAILLAHECGAKPRLNEYSPIPGTAEWEKALALCGPALAEEPLWQNNSFYFTRPETGWRENFLKLKELAHAKS